MRLPLQLGSALAGSARRSSRPGSADCGASVLVGLLWCLALLSVLVIGILHSTRMDLQVARLHNDRIQARYLALAGVEKAKALIYRDARERSRTAQSHSGSLFNAPQQFRDVALGRGTFRVFRGGRPDEGGGVLFGVDDEESRLNVNVATAEDLSHLVNMPQELPPAILDWRDADRNVTPGGAELEYYAGMRPPSKPRDGPFQTVRELLMVRGMNPVLFHGEDTHLTGLAEETADDEGESSGAPSPGAVANAGWAASLTVNSGVNNVSASGQERVNVQTADEATLGTVSGITPEIAKAIVAHRGQNRLESLADLLDVGPAPPPGQNPNQNPGAAMRGPGLPGGFPGGGFPVPGGPSPNRGGANPGGPKVISQTLLMDIADSVTTDGASVQNGVMNVNTAGLEALMCLPGVSRELAQAIIGYRSSAGFLPSTAALLRVPGMTPEIFKRLAPRVTARSETYRILAEGRIRSSGVRQRLQVTVRIGLNDVQTLAYREDDL